MSAPIYRVIRERYYDSGRRDEVQSTEVLYCGTDRDEARVAYHRSTPTDRTETHAGDYGTRTRAQRIRERVTA